MDGQPIAITSRAFGSGPRTEQDTNQGTRFTVGIQGLFGSWDYDVSLLRSEAKVGGSLTDGYFSYLKVAKIINDPASTWNPWALGGVQDAATTAAFKSANYIGPTATGLSHLTSLDATASSNLMSLPGGNAQLALGASLRREDYKLGVSAILGSGDIAGLGGATLPENSSRTTTALFTELNLPLSKTFEANGSVRYDRYNDVGTTLNGKAEYLFGFLIDNVRGLGLHLAYHFTCICTHIDFHAF